MMILNMIVMRQSTLKVVVQVVAVTLIKRRNQVKVRKVLVVLNVENQMKNHRKKKKNQLRNEQVKIIKNRKHQVQKRVNQLLKEHLNPVRKLLNQLNLLKIVIVVIQIKQIFFLLQKCIIIRNRLITIFLNFYIYIYIKLLFSLSK
jgi:hypothetical protein